MATLHSTLSVGSAPHITRRHLSSSHGANGPSHSRRWRASPTSRQSVLGTAARKQPRTWLSSDSTTHASTRAAKLLGVGASYRRTHCAREKPHGGGSLVRSVSAFEILLGDRAPPRIQRHVSGGD